MNQQQHLKRVASTIAPAIMEFARSRFAQDREFHAQTLCDYVSQHHTVAPDSAGRILRMLRRSGALDYVVVDRGQSLYRLIMVKDEAHG